MDKSQLKIESSTAQAQIKRDSIALDNSITSAAVVAIKLAYCGDATDAAQLVEVLTEYASKKAVTAFKYLAVTHSGASLKDGGSIDSKRQEKNRDNYAQVLETVAELGLIDWYASVTDSDKEEKAGNDTPATKQAKKEASALKTLANIAADSDDEHSIIMKQVLEYKASLEKVAKYNPAQANDMHNKTIGSLAKAMLGSINNLKDPSIGADDTEEAA